MKVNEEVDALVTMGFDPGDFLAVPKVFASMAVVPLLTLFSDLAAIMGGACVGILGLDLTLYTYASQTSWALTVFDSYRARSSRLSSASLSRASGASGGSA
jgi:phospholipid/cholesterol/gamma-HCH transport system permease protein